ncbi:MAG: bacillithiol biosynthesis cysteine-adding enzyme BshC, partial [Bacteroidetes bacterium]|nr:bacillithiol biosynthesis cysteine-adding enzyme BshC [Bacteroidota bacterium]
MLKKHTISFADTKQFSKLFLDYINRKEKLRPFYKYEPEIASFKQAMEDKGKEKINRKLLVDVLISQNSKLPFNNFTIGNINQLLNDNAFTVCTGHQLCLFTGPLYFIYKIITTINLAEALKRKYPESNFVPVYWMASEDHDFEEVSSIHLFGTKINWQADHGGAVGHLKTASMNLVIEEINQILGDSENAKELKKIFVEAYLEHTDLAEATRFLVHHLFGEYGLVIIDADDARLKSEFLDIIKDDISNNTNFKIVNQTISDLENYGYKAQVNPREINIFRISENDRIRIQKANHETLNYNPEEYSPNVVLRPLYQQKILPNLAYVGGPGEIAYWLEYKAMFDHHKINFPVLIPRNFALISDEKAEQQIQKFGLSRTDIFKDINGLIKEFVSNNASSDVSLNEQEMKLTEMFKELSTKVNLVDPTLKASVEAEFQKALSSLKNIENKLLRSEKQKQETNINQIKKLKEKFLPEGILQER